VHFGQQVKAALRAHEQEYAAALERHFVRHLEPFARADPAHLG